MTILRGATLAVSFLTVLPVRLGTAPLPLAAAAPWFPVVGAIVGTIAGGVLAGAEELVGPFAASVLAAATLIAITGALHQDGLADCADAVGARGGTQARRLEVMRDSAIGTFGALALLVWLLLVVAALAGVATEDGIRAVVLAAASGRWAALLHAVATRPARTEGLGASFAPGSLALGVATLVVAVGAVLLVGPGQGAAALAGAVLAAAVVSAASRRGIGGRTGDTLGATVCLAEVAVLLTLLAFA